MKSKLQLLASTILLLSLISCGIYSFGGVNLDNRVKTVQVDYFPNNARLIEPSLSQAFTVALQDIFISQTNLDMVKSGGDIHFSGEITGYRINPMTATAEQTAAQNRLTITVQVRYVNKYEEDKDFEQSFSFYHDYDANAQLVGGVLDEAFQVIFERITQDIFNASVAQW
ncbi:LptE family protein [Urechidicola vernalis]|uniref:LptE family protein n=1 Tax=Urechidicola vernalis TaxID=3075600 RepID=A0ABU2Y640_9FLAO|nr:LptE family protein [Urechidicola sp. P050]MDT0553271.1 LptE family protein [Urechidicola sp. P050]